MDSLLLAKLTEAHEALGAARKEIEHLQEVQKNLKERLEFPTKTPVVGDEQLMAFPKLPDPKDVMLLALACRTKQKIPAIKAYRALMGASLKEAKTEIDKIFVYYECDNPSCTAWLQEYTVG